MKAGQRVRLNDGRHATLKRITGCHYKCPVEGFYWAMTNPSLGQWCECLMTPLDEGVKHDDGKLRYDLLDDAAMDELVAVLTVGAIKYDDNNWRKLDNLDARYTAAGRRHDSADRQGELLDPEDELMHLAHEMCCVMFRLAKKLEEHPELNKNRKERLARAIAKIKERKLGSS